MPLKNDHRECTDIFIKVLIKMNPEVIIVYFSCFLVIDGLDDALFPGFCYCHHAAKRPPAETVIRIDR